MVLTEGLLVTHPAFGPGRVLLANGHHVWVYFPDVRGTAKDAVKQLAIARCHLSAASGLNDPRLAYIPVKIVNGILQFPKSARISHDDAVAHFLSRFPSGFRDEKLVKRELGYKREASALFERLFGRQRGRTMLLKGRVDEIASAIDDLFHATNISATQEIIAVHDGIKDRQAAAILLAEVLDFVDEPGPESFAALVNAVDSLPAQPGKARVLTWPIVTLLPFLADPRRFIVLKPTMTKAAAERLFFDLAYDSRPNWSTYERTLAFATSLRELLKPHGARDFIDVQSFIWVTAGEPAMNAKEQQKSD